MSILKKLIERGLISFCSDVNGLDSLMSDQKICCYLGMDCTASSLHVGHVIPLMLARWLAQDGHKIILLLGGATSLIGDPSGKDKTRPQLDSKEVDSNAIGIQALAAKFCDEFIVENNASWFGNMKYIEFLRDFGRFFSVNEMLTLDSVAERLSRNHHMNFVEFNYALLQSYDFMELNKRHGCVLQIGGSDQWGNISRGISVGKRLGLNLYGVTTPLLTTVDGRKMGKTENGAVWLDANLLSPYEYYQFFRNVEDDNVERWLGYFTQNEYPLGSINIMKEHLAYEATAICHGKEAADDAHAKAKGIFASPIDLSIKVQRWPLNLEDTKKYIQDCNDIILYPDEYAYNLPDKQDFRSQQDIMAGLRIAQVLVDNKLATSLGNAKSLIEQGAVKLNARVVGDIAYILTIADFKRGGVAHISVGKKQHCAVLKEASEWVMPSIKGSIISVLAPSTEYIEAVMKNAKLAAANAKYINNSGVIEEVDGGFLVTVSWI